MSLIGVGRQRSCNDRWTHAIGLPICWQSTSTLIPHYNSLRFTTEVVGPDVILAFAERYFDTAIAILLPAECHAR